jgi:hypothetical protein
MREKQRTERIKKKLKKKKNKYLVKLYQMKNQQLAYTRAKQELGMEELQPSQIVTMTFEALSQ